MHAVPPGAGVVASPMFKTSLTLGGGGPARQDARAPSAARLVAAESPAQYPPAGRPGTIVATGALAPRIARRRSKPVEREVGCAPG